MEEEKQYFYHSDHLGSAQLVTNYRGEQYEHIEYTPYGELWVEVTALFDELDVPYRFTGKERDVETGLYYYGARYLDPKTSRWLSTDPALSEYIPGAPINDDVRKKNGNLPGMGGVFNTVNYHLYHYAGNNPVKYTDPDGREDYDASITKEQYDESNLYKQYTWDQVQSFFEQNPDGALHRYPDEAMFSQYENKNDISKNGMMEGSTDILNAFLIGKSALSLGKAIASDIAKKQAAKTIAEISTGRTVAANLPEKLAMEAVKAKPEGKILENIVMGDPRLPASAGWVKMEQKVNNVIIHYAKNLKTNAVADFKFK
jgi:RHS repeat-associated protein